MNHASLFTGIGGFDLAAEWMDWENIFQVENNEWCQKILKQNFPKAIRYADIKEFDATKYRGTIDVLSGGPPCQPASIAGNRKGTNDNRWLWPETIRIFGEIRPNFGVFENPDDLLTLEDGEPFERICCQMEDFGYKVETYGIPAACVEAWHERDRIWIIAQDINSIRCNSSEWKEKSNIGGLRKFSTRNDERFYFEANASNINSHKRSEGRMQTTESKETERYIGSLSSRIDRKGQNITIESPLVRKLHGIPNRVDRIKGLGNAIVPQVAYEIFKAIQEVNNAQNPSLQGQGRDISQDGG